MFHWVRSISITLYSKLISANNQEILSICFFPLDYKKWNNLQIGRLLGSILKTVETSQYIECMLFFKNSFNLCCVF